MSPGFTPREDECCSQRCWDLKDGWGGSRIRHLPDSVLGLQHPLTPQDGNTHPHFPTSQELQQPQNLQKEWDTLPTYFPAYAEGRHGIMDLSKATYWPKLWEVATRLRSLLICIQTEQRCDGLLFKSRKNGSAFCFLPTSNARPLFFSCQIQQQTVLIFGKLARYLLWPCLLRTTGSMKSLG